MGFLSDIVDRERVNQHIDQGSDQWDEIRLGRFTSSEFWKLMDFGKRPMTEKELAARPKTGKGSKTTTMPDFSKFSPGGETYIRVKVAETLTGVPRPQAYAYPLVYGKEMEPQAVEYFEVAKGLKCTSIGFQPFGDHAGGSPDRIIEDSKWGLEVKCPLTSDKQIDYLYLTDHYTLKLMYPDYYWQCVSLMFFMDFDGWHFCTFDPRFKSDKHKLTHIEILAKDCGEDYDLIALTLENAVKQKLEMIQVLDA
jgi:hypothetical protein